MFADLTNSMIAKRDALDSAITLEEARIDRVIKETTAAHGSMEDNYWNDLRHLREQRRMAIKVLVILADLNKMLEREALELQA